MRRVSIFEKGETLLDLTLAQAMELQDLQFCRVTPTSTEGRWRVTDVSKVGVVVVDDLALHVAPKTPLQNIVYMASLGGHQLRLEDEIEHGIDAALPSAIARAFLVEVRRATRRGLVKGYRTLEETSAVVRGRWDIARQLAARPGIPLPLEIEFDDFTENIAENRILTTALRIVRGVELDATAASTLRQLLVVFADVEPLPRGMPMSEPPITRLNEHYAVALRLARVILDSVSWTHRDGAHRGGTFLVGMAGVFEAYVANRLRHELEAHALQLTTQDRRWWLDIQHAVALRPDLVVSSGSEVMTVADTKYKVIANDGGAAPNADVYQALAYALALGVTDAHLIYVSGDVVGQELHIPNAGVRVHLHAVSLDGAPEDIDASVAAVSRALESAPGVTDERATARPSGGLVSKVDRHEGESP